MGIEIERVFYTGPVSYTHLDVYKRQCHCCRRAISIHALRMERDIAERLEKRAKEISIHALRMERDSHHLFFLGQDQISIHALRMERDSAGKSSRRRRKDFYPRAPHGARHGSIGPMRSIGAFLSTRSAWSATRVIQSDQ